MRVYVLLREDIDGHGGRYTTVSGVTLDKARARAWEKSSEIMSQWYEEFTPDSQKEQS